MWTLLCIRWNIKSPIFSLWYLVSCQGSKTVSKSSQTLWFHVQLFPVLHKTVLLSILVGRRRRRRKKSGLPRAWRELPLWNGSDVTDTFLLFVFASPISLVTGACWRNQTINYRLPLSLIFIPPSPSFPFHYVPFFTIQAESNFSSLRHMTMFRPPLGVKTLVPFGWR